jgi:hypothetical protein
MIYRRQGSEAMDFSEKYMVFSFQCPDLDQTGVVEPWRGSTHVDATWTIGRLS